MLSAAFGGAVLTGGVAAVPVGRIADRRGVRGLTGLGALLALSGLAGFAAATEPWHVLLVWWVVLGPATALTFYEPAYVAIDQWFDRAGRVRAVATLTLLAGFSGPVAIPATTALVTAFGWRAAAAVLGAVVATVSGLAALLVIRAPAGVGSTGDPRASAPLRPLLRDRRFLLFTVAALLGYGAFEATIVHRVARFSEAGFALGVVAGWAAASGILSLPGRYLLPRLTDRVRGTTVFAGVLAVMAVAVAIAADGTQSWQLVGHFSLFGLVLGAALPLRAVVMADWYSGAAFGRIMGAQAAVIALSRAGGPALTGALRDALGGYSVPMVLLAAAFAAAAVLTFVSGHPRHRPAGAAAPASPGPPAGG